MKVDKKVKLGSIISVLTDYHANGSYKILKKNVELLDDPNYALIIRTKNFEQKNFEDNKYINENAYNFLKKSKVYPNDILMNKIANAGSVYLMPDLKQPVSLGMNLFLIRIDSKLADPRFVYYSLKINEKYIKLFSTGAAAQTITKEMVKRLEITLPDLFKQQKIVSIISNYNDLIEINNRRKQLLEEITRLIFHEWFVYFRFPGNKKVKIINGIPEGWEKTDINKIAIHVKKSYSINDENLPLVDLARIQSKTLAITEVGSSPDLETSRIIFEKDDILFSSIRPYLHKVVLAPFKGITNVSVFVIRAKKLTLRAFLTILLSSNYAIQYANQHSTGTKMPVVKWDSISKMSIIIPPENIMNKFQNMVGSMLEKIQLYYFQNQKLTQARDLLLPKLMSGAIKV